MAIFFTADTHFGHTNIIKYDNRPFASAAEMNEALVANWNCKVSPTDTVYHLGDVSILRPERTHEILERLNGKTPLPSRRSLRRAASIISSKKLSIHKTYRDVTCFVNEKAIGT